MAPFGSVCAHRETSPTIRPSTLFPKVAALQDCSRHTPTLGRFNLPPKVVNPVPQGCCPPRLFQAYSNIGKIQFAPQGSEPCSQRLLPSKTVPGILQHWEDSTCPPKVVPASSRLTCPTRLDQDVLQEDLTWLSLQDPQETPCPSRATLSPKAGHPN